MATYERSSRAQLGQHVATVIEDARHAYFARLDELDDAGDEYLDYDDCDACVARVALQAIDGYLLATTLAEGR